MSFCLYVEANAMNVVAVGDLGYIWKPHIWDFAELLG